MSDLPPMGMRMHQISDDDLETCEDAIAALRPLVTDIASIPEREHFLMLAAAIKRVRDDYGPHTNLTIIPANK